MYAQYIGNAQAKINFPTIKQIEIWHKCFLVKISAIQCILTQLMALKSPSGPADVHGGHDSHPELAAASSSLQRGPLDPGEGGAVQRGGWGERDEGTRAAVYDPTTEVSPAALRESPHKDAGTCTWKICV